MGVKVLVSLNKRLLVKERVSGLVAMRTYIIKQHPYNIIYYM